MGKHPWEITLRQFLERVEREYGGGRVPLFAFSSQGRIDVSFVQRSSEEFATLPGLDLDEELTPTVLRSLCVQLGLPPDLFGLEPEEPYYPDVN